MTEDRGNSATGRALNILPCEILFYIFSYLDNPAPSVSRLHDQPSFGLTECKTMPLKSVSKVSKKWRRQALRLLLRNTRCLLEYHLDAVRPSLNTTVKPFLDLIHQESLQLVVESFTLGLSVGVAEMNYKPIDHPPSDCVSFWRNLLDVIDPFRVTIIAPSLILAALTSCPLVVTDSTDFHMPYHIFSLSRPRHSPRGNSTTTPSSLPRNSPTHRSSLFNLRPWASLLLNEGSFIRLYSLLGRRWHHLHSILPSLVGSNAPHARALFPSTIRTLSYIAVFPFLDHFAQLLLHLPPRLDALHVQLVPASELAPDEWQRSSVDVAYLACQRDLCYQELLELLVDPTAGESYGSLGEVSVREGEGGEIDEGWKVMARRMIKGMGDGWTLEEGGLLRRQEGWAPPVVE